MHKFVFLDTNIFLHYQDIDNINWLDVVAADTVTLSFPTVTLHELNKIKDSQYAPRIRKRAGTVIKQLNTWYQSGDEPALRQGVTFRIEDREPLIEFAEHHLSREVQDDYLIATILMYQQQSSDLPIALVTSDAGLTLVAKAGKRSIATFGLSDNFKLPDEPDPNEVQIKQLEQQIRELTSKLPKLSLTFQDGAQHGKFVLPAVVELSPEQLAEEIATLKKEHPRLGVSSTQPVASQTDSTTWEDAMSRTAKMIILGTIAAEDIAEYDNAREQFFLDYSNYLQRASDYENLTRRTIRLELLLANDGTAPADDVDILLHFPDGFILRTYEEFPPGPNPPKPPSPPKSQIEKITEGFGSNFYLPHPDIHRDMSPIQPPSNVSPHKTSNGLIATMTRFTSTGSNTLRWNHSILYCSLLSLSKRHVLSMWIIT